MVLLKELINDLGGGRSIGLGALLLIFVYVAADQYVETVETRFHALRDSFQELEARQNGDDRYHGQGARFTAEQGKALSRRVDRLEVRVDRYHE